MNNSDMPAMPQPMVSADDGEIYSTLDNYGSDHAGLTKREYFAGLAMQGLLANGLIIDIHDSGSSKWIAEHATSQADALLLELENENT